MTKFNKKLKTPYSAHQNNSELLKILKENTMRIIPKAPNRRILLLKKAYIATLDQHI